ncbi:hypothetical protein [Streptomyces viridochromogenes]|uniref:hypothetical protein n=1 Tax=Streptomyces viridochromogenes TaxID=1938 RepID=UPI00069F88B1|nr:hypothetical protein [Streptomyces viridochromogenes]KOG26306.1 hypothetical protein ADK35_07840 [Streptomyces viridochromogenes]KOG26778.1 hypothetical protein ADK36_02105 [Streptomyces viridochromogenes]
MTSSSIRRRPRRGTSHLSVRVLLALAGGLVGVVWLVLPATTVGGAAAGGADRPVAGAVAQQDDEGTSDVDLVMPALAVVAAAVLAGYGFIRRRRRARGRTTPGGAPVQAAEPPAGELDERARALLVEADDWVRVSAEELGFAQGRFEGEDLAHIEKAAGVEYGAAVEPFARALRDAAAELAVAFRMRWQYEGGVPQEGAARRHALAGIVGRCQEAGRLLDAQAAAFDQLRGLEQGLGEGLGHALVVAEGRFRELAGRTGGADAALRELGERYGPSATAAVAGHVEQAKDRLVFATTRLNHARQSADSGDNERAAARLRAAEGAIAQAAVFIEGVERLSGDLATASALVPAALTGGEAEIAGARESLTGVGAPYPDVPPGELRARVTHADLALASVREELTAGRPYDPLGLLRRIVRAVGPVAAGRTGVIPAAALLCARGAVDGGDDVVATHRAAVGSEARTRLAEARRLLTPPASLADLLAADTLARQAHDLAEQDIRVHGHPADGPTEDINGLAGALLGGILTGGDPASGPPGSFGGPRTRGRHTGGPTGA